MRLVLLALLVAAVAAAAVAVSLAASARQQRRQGPAIDPFTVQEPWRRFVQDALQARNRVAAAVGEVRAGPLRTQLDEVLGRLDHAVAECWAVARRGHAVDRARRQLDAPGARARLAALEAGDPDGTDPAASALRAQLQAADRLAVRSDDTRARLRTLTARLDEAAAHALELSVAAGPTIDVPALARSLEDVAGELGALRLALEETSRG